MLLQAQAAGFRLGKCAGKALSVGCLWAWAWGSGGEGGGLSTVTLQFSEMCCWDGKASRMGPG